MAKYKFGLTFGGYCPMHQGHLDCIMQAKKECDCVYVVVCGYDNEPRAVELGLPHIKRLRMIQDYFRGDEIIKVIGINDTELGIDESMSYDNWHIWLEGVFEEIYNISDNFNGPGKEDIVRIYVGEPKYKEELNHLKEEGFYIEPVLVGYDSKSKSRTNNVSATNIRIRPQKYWNKIVAPFKPYLTHKILITGTASEGKTTMAQDLSKYFQCPITTEYGRDYMERRNLKDQDLTFQDFLAFISGQNQYYEDAIKSPGNNGIIISDTDNLVTLMYANAYATNSEMNINMDEYLALYHCVKSLGKNVKWDKIFVLPPKNNFVNDGIRYMGQASMEERQKNFDKLMGLLEDFGLMNKVEVLYSDYAGNFNRVKEYINELYL